MYYNETIMHNVSTNQNNSIDIHQPPNIMPWFQTSIYICFLLTFAIGSAGNMLLCYILIKRKEARRTIHLLTLNLAASDLLVLIVYLPMQLYQINALLKWEIGKEACTLFYGINAITVNANFLTLIAITRDRYVAVTDPLTAHSRSSSAVRKWLIVIWLTSIVLSLPLLIVVDVRYEYCFEIWPSFYLERIYWIILFVLQLVGPLFYFICVYTLLIYRMRIEKSACDFSGLYKHGENCYVTRTRNTRRRKKQQMKLLKLAIILVVAYVVCVLPQHTVFFAVTYGTLAANPNAAYIFIISNFLLTFNSLLNPMIYASQSREMKALVYRMLCSYKLLIDSIKTKRKKDVSHTTSTTPATPTAVTYGKCPNAEKK